MEELSHKKEQKLRVKTLGEYINPLAGDIYETALNLFPARTLEEI